ncbi:MAG: PP2C family protein-serine/threonine phosphatase [Thermonemataceae bacterium]
MIDAAILKRKELALNSLLEITQAINNNLPENFLYRIYNFILRGNLNISKLALYVWKEEWVLATHFGVDLRHLTFHNDLFASNIEIMPPNEAQRQAGYDIFDVVIPILHKHQVLAFVLATGVANEEVDTDFMQTLTNIIVVAIENKRLAQEQLAQEVLKKELEIAQKVQNLLFPKSLPYNEHLQVKAYYTPHSSVGGDYYDYIPISDDQFLFCIADVSGKGMAAALMMANFQASLRTITRQTTKLIKVIEELNYLIHENAQGENFITFFVGIYHNKEKTLNYINAGHNPPFLFTADGKFRRLDKGTTVLGVFDPLPFMEETTLAGLSNFLIFSYTDGLNETLNPQEELFGEERIEHFLKHNYQHNLEQLHHNLIQTLKDFKRYTPYNDDITLLSLKHTAP